MKSGAEIYAIWKGGIPLSQAFYRFMPKDMQERWRHLHETNSNGSLAWKITSFSHETTNPDPQTLKSFLEGLVDHNASRERSDLENELKALCLKWIRTGKLKAYGFTAPRTAHDLPIEVPADLWEQTPHWSRETINANGLRLEAIRIVRSETAPAPAQKGRPSRRQDILLAYSELVSNGRISFSGTLKAAAQLTRLHILDQNPIYSTDARGLGLRAIEIQISDLFQSEKARRKKNK